MGSKTPITHALSWFILSVIDFRIGHRRTAGWPPHRERPVWLVHCNHRWVGQGRYPHPARALTREAAIIVDRDA
jgi:hypothetical protein